MSESPDRLLALDDPLPVRVLRPEGRSDFVLTADHAGRAIPKRLGMLGLPEDELARHIAWDIGIAGVTERLSEALGAAAVLQNYSRLVIDCNRQPGLDSSIPTVSELTAIPANEGLSSDAREARQREIFQPYHARIEQLLESRSASGRRTLLIAMHSFTPVFKSIARKSTSVFSTIAMCGSRISCSTCCGMRAISMSATTSPTRSAISATTRCRYMANSVGCRMSRSRSARI